MFLATQTQHQLQRRIGHDVVVREQASILELLAGEDKALLLRWDALFWIFYFTFHITSDGSTSRVMGYVRVRVFTKICMLTAWWGLSCLGVWGEGGLGS